MQRAHAAGAGAARYRLRRRHHGGRGRAHAGEHVRGARLRREPGRDRARDPSGVHRPSGHRPVGGRAPRRVQSRSSAREPHPPPGDAGRGGRGARRAEPGGPGRGHRRGRSAGAGSGADRNRVRNGSGTHRGAAEAIPRRQADGGWRRAGTAGSRPDAGRRLRRRPRGERDSRRHHHGRRPGGSCRRAGRRLSRRASRGTWRTDRSSPRPRAPAASGDCTRSR